MSRHKPHHWQYSKTNGFWAHCNCGFSASSLFDSMLVRKMDRHVREATTQAALELAVYGRDEW